MENIQSILDENKEKIPDGLYLELSNALCAEYKRQEPVRIVVDEPRGNYLDELALEVLIAMRDIPQRMAVDYQRQIDSVDQQRQIDSEVNKLMHLFMIKKKIRGVPLREAVVISASPNQAANVEFVKRLKKSGYSILIPENETPEKLKQIAASLHYDDVSEFDNPELIHIKLFSF